MLTESANPFTRFFFFFVSFLFAWHIRPAFPLFRLRVLQALASTRLILYVLAFIYF